MIDPLPEDIGRSVIYTGGAGETERGIITSFNDKVVFVRYEKQHPTANGQATAREDLTWETPSIMVGYDLSKDHP